MAFDGSDGKSIHLLSTQKIAQRVTLLTAVSSLCVSVDDALDELRRLGPVDRNCEEGKNADSSNNGYNDL